VDPEAPDWDTPIEHFDFKDEENVIQSKGFKDAPVKKTFRFSVPTMGEAYRGKKISRKDIMENFDNEGDVKDDNMEKEDNDVDMEDHEMDNGDVNGENNVEENSGDNNGEEMGVDNNNGEKFDVVLGNDVSSDSDDKMGDFALKTFDEADELEKQLEQENEENIAISTTVSPQEELNKAKSTKNQKIIWSHLLGLRIRMQNPLSIGNILPQSDTYQKFIDQSDDIKNIYEDVHGELSSLLSELLLLQKSLLIQNKNTELNLDEFDQSPSWDNLFNMQQSLKKYQDGIIEKWYTRALHTMMINTNKFKALNQSILTQIDKLLSGKNKNNTN